MLLSLTSSILDLIIISMFRHSDDSHLMDPDG